MEESVICAVGPLISLAVWCPRTDFEAPHKHGPARVVRSGLAVSEFDCDEVLREETLREHAKRQIGTPRPESKPGPRHSRRDFHGGDRKGHAPAVWAQSVPPLKCLLGGFSESNRNLVAVAVARVEEPARGRAP